jgi:hypothetical protein
MGAAVNVIEQLSVMAKALGYVPDVTVTSPAYGGYRVKVGDIDCGSSEFEGACARAHETLSARISRRIEQYQGDLEQLQAAIQEVPSEDA